jgi:hypothetical protein
MSRTVLFHPGAFTLIKGILYINNKDPNVKGYFTYSLQEYRDVLATRDYRYQGSGFRIGLKIKHS